MNKASLVKEVSKKTGISEKIIREVYDAMTKTILDKLFFGEDVKLNGFLTFKIKTRKATVINNPNKPGELRTLPKRYFVSLTLPREFVKKISSKTVY